jgi:hypothetical protein
MGQHDFCEGNCLEISTIHGSLATSGDANDDNGLKLLRDKLSIALEACALMTSALRSTAGLLAVPPSSHPTERTGPD